MSIDDIVDETFGGGEPNTGVPTFASNPKAETTNIYLAVSRQHFHFGVHAPSDARHLDPREKRFRFRAMREELEEYEEAETLEEELDALVDLVVFALGTAYLHGFHRFNTALMRVVEANKKKVVGPTARGAKYGDLDLQKPADWKPADLSDLVKGGR